MGTAPALHVDNWGALFLQREAPADARGNVATLDTIPASLRRRMPSFLQMSVCCALGVMTSNSELVFASRYGDMETAAKLLSDIAAEVPLSPTAFASSVHNASAGLASQLTSNRASHTAVAAGDASLRAGLLEAYLRLATGEATQVALVYSDVKLPSFYSEFETEQDGGLCVGMSLSLAMTKSESYFAVDLGRVGAYGLVSAMERGHRTIAAVMSS